MPPKPIIAIFGPTGVGKTAITLALAERLRQQGEHPVAVSADALQVYKGLELLTAAPTPEQRLQLEHRLVGFLDADQTFSVGEYARLAHREIDSLLAEGKRPIIVGGTGLYLRAAVAELDLRPPPPPEVRRYWQSEIETHGPQALHERLNERDPEIANQIVPTDSRRIVRAHELLDIGERPLIPPANTSQLWTSKTRHPTLLAGLTIDREELAQRIDARVDAMVQEGVIEQVRCADAGGTSITARKALGFSQLLQGDIAGTKLRTRQYARRQLTWMRKLADVQTVDVTERYPDDIAAELHEMLSASVQ